MTKVGVFEDCMTDILNISYVYLGKRLLCLKSSLQTIASELSCLPPQDMYYLMHARFCDINLSLQECATGKSYNCFVLLQSIQLQTVASSSQRKTKSTGKGQKSIS